MVYVLAIICCLSLLFNVIQCCSSNNNAECDKKVSKIDKPILDDVNSIQISDKETNSLGIQEDELDALKFDTINTRVEKVFHVNADTLTDN
jgi:hypothetical protein